MAAAMGSSIRKHLPGAGGFRRLPHGALFHLGDTRGHGNDDARPDKGPPIVDLVDKVAQHGFGHFEIGNHPVPHGADSHDITRGAAQHVLGFQTHGQHAIFGAVVCSNGNHRGLAENDALAFNVH